MELLKGKAKELFEEWLQNQEVAPYKVMFYDIPIIVQQSYIIEWLDSVGYNIHSDNLYDDFYFKIRLGFEEIVTFGKAFNSRQEATTEAIKKAVELINKDYEQRR